VKVPGWLLKLDEIVELNVESYKLIEFLFEIFKVPNYFLYYSNSYFKPCKDL
jgi:hypothetical protein